MLGPNREPEIFLESEDRDSELPAPNQTGLGVAGKFYFAVRPSGPSHPKANTGAKLSSWYNVGALINN